VSGAPARPLLSIGGLYVYFPLHSTFMRTSRAFIKAVDGVDLEVGAGETVGLVGESGCGKTTLGLAALRLVEPTAGKVAFDGTDLVSLSRGRLRRFRRHMQVIFQNPYGSLNPRMTVSELVGEGMRVHGLTGGGARARRAVEEALALVGLDARFADRYPHELSGGERQRICIARAVALQPRLVVADEALSALDVSVQAQIANLLRELQEKLGVAYLFISHDLKMVKFLSRRIYVMYLGKVVETAGAEDLFLQPMHPYTRILMESIPLPDPLAPSPWQRTLGAGEIPSLIDPPEGCRFRTRCRFAFERCAREEPEPGEIRPGHRVACHLVAGVTPG